MSALAVPAFSLSSSTVPLSGSILAVAELHTPSKTKPLLEEYANPL